MALVMHKDIVYQGQDPYGKRFFHVIKAGNPHGPVWSQLRERWRQAGKGLSKDVGGMLRELLRSADDQLELPFSMGGQLTIAILQE